MEQQQQDEISLIYGDEFEVEATTATTSVTGTSSAATISTGGGGPLKEHNQQNPMPPLKRLRS